MNPISPLERLAHYPLLDALIEYRSRRFGSGMSINGGPLAYDGTRGPQPLSLEEEATLRPPWPLRLVASPAKPWPSYPTKAARCRRRASATS